QMPDNTIRARQVQELSQLNRNSINVTSNLQSNFSTTDGSPTISAMFSANSGVEADTTTEQIGELFQYHIAHPVTITKNQSALIPIVQAQVEGESLSIYNEAVRQGNPLNGLKLKNTTGLTLEGGPITIIDGDSYAGEALIDRFKPGETRFISY